MKLLSLAVIPIFVAAFFFVTTGPVSGHSAIAVTPMASSFSAASTSASSVWWVGAESTDSSALPNTGVRGTIGVISMTVVGCLAYWVADDLSNSVWGQVGYDICGGSTPQAFYQIWNLNSNTVLSGGDASVTTGSHTFSMSLQSGTTWVYSLDGTPMGTYDMGASVSSSSYPVEAMSEEQGTSVFSIPEVTFAPALQVLQSGSWRSVSTATSYGTAWGVEGASQTSSLSPDELIVGGSLPTIAQGTNLWSSGSSTTTSSTTSLPPVTSTVTTTLTSTQTVTSTTTRTVTATSTTTATSMSTVTSTSTLTSTKTSTVTSTTTAPGSTTTVSGSTTTVTNPGSTTTVTSTATSTTTEPAQSTTTLTSTSTSTSPTTVTVTTGPTVTSTVTEVASSTLTSTTASTVTRVTIYTIDGPPSTTTSTVTRTGMTTVTRSTTITKTVSLVGTGPDQTQNPASQNSGSAGSASLMPTSQFEILLAVLGVTASGVVVGSRRALSRGRRINTSDDDS